MRTIKDMKITYVTQVPNSERTRLIDKVNETNYLKEILAACKKPLDPKSAGFTYDDIKSIDRIKRLFEGVKDNEVKIEEIDYKFIKRHLETQTWVIPCIEFVEMVDYIKNLKEE